MKTMWTLVKRTESRGCVGIAMKLLYDALAEQNIAFETALSAPAGLENAIVIALHDEGDARALGTTCSERPESYAVAPAGKGLSVVASDERGLAYALTELAEQIQARGEAALTDAAPRSASPSTAIRGVDRFISNSWDCDWWMSENFWRNYLEMMLRSRFNRLTVTLGFDTAYLSPPYPFFVDVPGFEHVRVVDEKMCDRAAYLAALRQIGALAHEYGMEFSLAIWQQQPWQSGQANLIAGLENVDQLMEYCALGIETLLTACPEIDIVQYRVNHESGVGTQVSAEDYWLHQIEAVARVNREVRPVRLELRAKGMTDRMVEHGKELGLDVSISTKYWCEQAGLPHHMTQMRTQELGLLHNFNHSRRYSYADMLRKPRTHQIIYRLWNNGSTNLFTWGDPDYVRRFVDSMRLGPAAGFEVMPPLSYKGGHEFELHRDWKLFDNPAYQPEGWEGWEDERYWLFYRLFGRIGYDIAAGEDAWMLEMERRFGAGAHDMAQAIALASGIIPLLVAWHFPDHPQEIYWAELSTGASMFGEHNLNDQFRRNGVSYGSSLPSDEGLFYSIDQYVAAEKNGTLDGRYTPWQALEWTARLTAGARDALARAQKAGLKDNWESRGVALDIEMVTRLADFHQEKARAAVALSRFQQYDEPGAAGCAVRFMRAAIAEWKKLCDLGAASYHDNLIFGVGENLPRKGNWGDYMDELQRDLDKLVQLEREHPSDVPMPLCEGPGSATAPDWFADIPASHPAHTALDVFLATPAGEYTREGIKLRLRHTNNLEGVFRTLPMQRVEGGWKATIPAEEMDPQWDLMLYFQATGRGGEGLNYPGLYNRTELQPYFIIRID